jgi:hypothetical protein
LSQFPRPRLSTQRAALLQLYLAAGNHEESQQVYLLTDDCQLPTENFINYNREKFYKFFVISNANHKKPAVCCSLVSRRYRRHLTRRNHMLEHLQMVQRPQMEAIQRQAEQRRQFPRSAPRRSVRRLRTWFLSLF